MPSRSPTPRRDAASRSPYSRASRSPSRTPRRSISPRPSPSPQRRSRSRTRTRSPAHSRSRSRSHRARSTSRGQRDRSPTPPMPRSSKVSVSSTLHSPQQAANQKPSTYGTIADLDMPLNKSFNTNRGTAYILYHSPEAAERAIAHMHEGQLDGAKIGVSIVLPRRRFSRSPPARRPPPNRFGEPHRYRDMAVAAVGGRGGGGGGGRGGRRRGGGGDNDGDTYRPGPARDAPPRNRSYSPRSRKDEEEVLEEEEAAAAAVEAVADAEARATAATARAAEAEAETAGDE
ncbi:unnamed protein product [Aureobasidium uvarum]|uniref:RRM domain-containing protein n=1 Tax=Aureobasidium uvarum TaxID=2773716 RepID=A0A9N8KLW9_9PEZI|nr:unnamed protein product [Aureobasidium uvarum]